MLVEGGHLWRTRDACWGVGQEERGRTWPESRGEEGTDGEADLTI